MKKEQLRILLVEDNAADAVQLKECVAAAKESSAVLTHVERFADVQQHLLNKNVDVVLLDLSLPDIQGIESVMRMAAEAPALPVIALTSLNDNGLSLEALRAGAQDYLVKGKTDCYLLARSIRYAVERKRVETLLRISEERYRTFFENIKDVFYRTDMKGIIKFISPSVKNYGYSVDEVIEKDVRLFYDNPVYREILVQILTTEKSVHDFELILRRKDGSQVHASLSAILIFDSGGKPLSQNCHYEIISNDRH